ncbi:Ig-like domain-containing protein, partial [Streptococcus pyogenes]
KTVATESVSLDKTAQTLTVGSSFVLTAALKPTNASNNTVQWTTSNPKVATVTNGNVVAVSPGSAVITARTVSGGKTAKANITVQAGKQ